MMLVNECYSDCHWTILGAWHLIHVVVSYFSTVSNTLIPLITCCECCDSAVGLETVGVEGDTLLETLNNCARLFSDECFRKEVNGGDECSELHLSGLVADELIIGHRVPCGSVSGHFVCWHTGDSETLDLIGSPCITCLLYHTLHLPLHALVSRTLATLAEVRNRVLWGRERLDHDLVVRVLDCCDCHWECLADELIIEHRRALALADCDTMRTVLIQLTAEQFRM